MSVLLLGLTVTVLPTSTAVGCRATYVTLWFPTQTSIAVGQDPRPMNTFFNTSTTLSNAGCGCRGGGGGLEKLRGCPQDLEKIVDSEQTEFRFRQHDGSSHKRFIDLSWIVSEKDQTLRSLYQGQLDTKNISFLTTCKLHDVKQCAWSSPCMWQPWQVWTQLDKNLMRKMLLEVSLFHNHDKFELGIRTWWGKNCLKFHFSNIPARSSKLAWKWKFKGHVWSHSLIDAAHIVTNIKVFSCGQLDELSLHESHTRSITFRHLPPNSARFGYATEGALFISTQLSRDTVSALWKVWVLTWLWKQFSAKART